MSSRPDGTEPGLIADTAASGGGITSGGLVALGRLVDECEAVLNALGALPEKDLAAWLYNCWYQALIEARAALADGRDWDAEPTLYDPNTGTHEA